MITNVLAIIAILVTVSGAAWYKTLKEVQIETKKSPGALVQEKNSTSTASLLAEPHAIFINTQKPGNIVVVDTVTLELPGFVAIHEVNMGKPGKIIGVSTLLRDGAAFNTTVALSRNSLEGEELTGVVHGDDGNGKFEALKDKPAKDRAGNIISVQFKVSLHLEDDEIEEAGSVLQ